ncbi:enterobactin transporter EntS [Pseudonocardia tropica]|uniref:Multidrug efflux pump Tap n=1 Tax=Pseudonocardia tropica TaxID=681289 RepID=A0ABV1JYV1_9PSEU
MIRELARGLLLDLTPLRDSRDLRLVVVARTVSMVGIGLLLVAVPVQVYALTGSSLRVGLVTAVVAVGAFAGTVVGGVVADRVDRRRVILVARWVATAGFAALLVNALAPAPSVVVIALAAAVDGVAGGVSATALGAAVPGIVGPDRLPAAGALLALTADAGAVVAPALAGLLIAAGGTWVPYAAALGTGVAAAVLVGRLGPLPPGDGEPAGSGTGALVEGLRFAVRHRVVGPVLLLGLLQMMLAAPYVLLPEFSDRVLGAGAATTGLLFAAPAVGAALASLLSGWTGRVRRAGAVLLAASGALGLAVLALGAVAVLPPGARTVAALAVLAAVGGADVILEILRFALLADHTPDRSRGRVTGIWTAQATVGDGVGAPLLGVVSRLLGPAAALALSGAAAVLATAVVALAVPALRRAGPAPDGREGPGRPTPPVSQEGP